MNMTCFPKSTESSKSVSFYGTVTVIYIPPINKLLKKELFYKSDDFQIFEMEAYIESVQEGRTGRKKQIEEEDSVEEEDHQQLKLCKDQGHDSYEATPLPLDPSLHGGHQAAIAA
jgi:hypothetical protein